MTLPFSDPNRFASRWGVQPAAPIVSAAKADLRMVRWDGVFKGRQEFPCQASAYSVVAVHENLIPNHTLLIDGREVRSGAIRPGAVQIVAAGAEAGGRCGAGEYHFTHLQLPKALLARVAVDLELLAFELVDPAYERTDMLLVELCRTLGRALPSPARVDQLYAEEIAHLVSVHVLRSYTAAPRAIVVPGALVGWRLKRVMAMIEETLPAPIDLQTMAEAASLSVSQFRAAFVAATGLAPSVFVMGRRIGLAKRALACSDSAIAQIAAECGFADQAHFTRRFRAVTGTTPAAYRADRR